MQMQRTDEFVLIHIDSPARTHHRDQKQSFYKEVARLLQEREKIEPDNVMIVLAENDLADWSFGRGEAQYVLNHPHPANKGIPLSDTNKPAS